MRGRRSRSPRKSVSSFIYRLAPFTAFSGVGVVAAFDSAYILASLCGVGAVMAGGRLLDRERNARKELDRRARGNVQELKNIARIDRVSSSQMERLASLQSGLLESWRLMPVEYHSLLDEDIFTVLEEVEEAAHLARRRAALRQHLESIDGRGIRKRIKSLEREVADLPEGSTLRETFERALAGRRNELEGCSEMLEGISLINAQLEGAESLLGSVRGDLLTLDSAPHALDSGLARLKERISLLRQSFDEVSIAVDSIPEPPGASRDAGSPDSLEPATGRIQG